MGPPVHSRRWILSPGRSVNTTGANKTWKTSRELVGVQLPQPRVGSTCGAADAAVQWKESRWQSVLLAARAGGAGGSARAQ